MEIDKCELSHLSNYCYLKDKLFSHYHFLLGVVKTKVVMTMNENSIAVP